MIPYSRQSISEADRNAVLEVLRSEFLTQGPKIGEFEDRLAEYFKADFAVCCSSGTAALHLAYAGLGADAQSIAIVPSITFAATANAFRYLGAKIVFCDVEPKSGILSLDHLQEILAEVTKTGESKKIFICAVSLAGRLAPLVELHEIGRKYGIRIIEDASHSFGSWSGTVDSDRRIRSGDCKLVDASCLSFHPVKHICCGEGGALLTHSGELADRARRLRSHGIHRPFDDQHETPWFYEQLELGWNYRMTDIQAALGISQLERIEDSLSRRREIARKYDDALNTPSFAQRFDCPAYSEGHAWHLYVIRFDREGDRDKAYKFLKNKGIQTQVHYLPLHRHPYYREQMGEISLPGAEKFSKHCLSIPIFPDLREDEQLRVISALADFTRIC